MVEKEILQQLEEIKKKALHALNGVKDDANIQAWRSQYLGRRSYLLEVMKNIPDMSKELRPKVGLQVNQVKKELEQKLVECQEKIRITTLMASLQNEKLDITLPGRKRIRGRLHPATRTLRKIYHIFREMGFQVFRTREVETEKYNFELLNIPQHHPARDMWSTFYTDKNEVILRTHTSPGQIHAMRESVSKPLRVILPGMVYRYAQVTARSEYQFNNVEVLAVGKRIDFPSFKGTLIDFARRMFGNQVRIRLRPDYFPFTEPSAEMDVECFICQGEGCTICKYSGWVEIMGCGMVHPVVLRNGGYDPRRFSGFAAGMGHERITMLRYKIDDIRSFWRNDVRFLDQF